jgi:ankyrin repeat protein
MLATFYHRHDCVEVLLQHSVDINARSGEGATALWYAASMGNLPIVKLLLARGADLEISDHRVGAAPLAVAAASGRLEIVDALLTNEPPSSINAQNKNGDTALMMAYASNEMACADRLLNNFPPADSMIANKVSLVFFCVFCGGVSFLHSCVVSSLIRMVRLRWICATRLQPEARYRPV